MPHTITDSGWFWVFVFSIGALLALQLGSSKYAERQAEIERQFQGRRYMQRQQQADSKAGAGAKAEIDMPGDRPPVKESGEAEFSVPGNTLIRLWPLKLAALVLILISLAMVIRQEKSAGQRSADRTGGTPLSSRRP